MKASRMEYNWKCVKWISMVLNVVIELCQATLTQENEQGKLSIPLYLKVSVATSCCCLIVSLVEIILEGKESKVVWRKRGYFWQGRLYGKFSLYFGIVSTMIQFIINFIAAMLNKKVVQFDMLPLLLAFGYLIAASIDAGEKAMLVCRIHRSFPFVFVSILRVSLHTRKKCKKKKRRRKIRRKIFRVSPLSVSQGAQVPAEAKVSLRPMSDQLTVSDSGSDSGGSSPLSDLTFRDFEDSNWDENELLLEKFPSVEIDWDAI